MPLFPRKGHVVFLSLLFGQLVVFAFPLQFHSSMGHTSFGRFYFAPIKYTIIATLCSLYQPFNYPPDFKTGNPLLQLPFFPQSSYPPVVFFSYSLEYLNFKRLHIPTCLPQPLPLTQQRNPNFGSSTFIFLEKWQT